MKFTCCPNLMFLASTWLKINRFSNWSFCWLWSVQNWYSFGWLWTSQNWPCLFSFPHFGQVDRSQLFCSVWAKQAAKNNPNPCRLIKNSRTTHRIWHMSFSMIQSVGIKNLVPQSINILQRCSLLFLFAAHFSDFYNKIKYAC